jgi:periplasmic protein TonB
LAARTYRLPSPYERTPPARRASGMALAIAINAAVLLALLGIGGITPVAMKDDGGTLVFDVARRDQAAAPSKPAEPQRKKTEAQRPVLPPPKHVLPVPPTITPPPAAELDLVELTKEELSKTDEAMNRPAAPALAQASGSGGDSAVVGKGPRGETLYAAEWMRRPTDQEISHYMPANTGPGYGMIACKTYPRFRVDDCVSLGSVPASARLDRVLLNAAWQFKVRPPRKNGQPMIGEWVRIRFDYGSAGD